MLLQILLKVLLLKVRCFGNLVTYRLMQQSTMTAAVNTTAAAAAANTAERASGGDNCCYYYCLKSDVLGYI